MKATSKKFFVMLLSLVMLATTCFGLLGNLQRRKADAWSWVDLLIRPEIVYDENETAVYYFSDSEPLTVNAQQFPNVTFDIHKNLLPQELKFMLYTGYFWGFIPEYNTKVILHLTASKHDETTLKNLIACLNAQNCTVIFMSPYYDEYDDLGANKSIPANLDEYCTYLRNSVYYMMDTSTSSLRNNMTVLLDGQFLNLEDTITWEMGYNVFESGIYSQSLQRILCYMYYDCDYEKELIFKEDIYKGLWSFYYTNFLYEYGFDEFSNFYSNPNIDDFIESWKYMDEYNSSNNDYRAEAWGENADEFAALYQQLAKSYFYNIMHSLLVNKKLHVLLHTGLSNFFDILDVDSDGNAQDYTIATPDDLCGFLNNSDDLNSQYLCAMGIWYLPQYLYNFLWSFQSLIGRSENDSLTIEDPDPSFLKEFDNFEETTKLPILIWERDPIIHGEGGLKIISNKKLTELYPSDKDTHDIQDLETLLDAALNNP